MNKDKLVIGLDIDGVLSQFNQAFKVIQIKTSKRDLFPSDWKDEQIVCWNWPTDQYGYTKEEYKAAWTEVWESPNFWMQLAPYPDAIQFLKKMRCLSNNIYYITQRAGLNVKGQTENWLRRFGGGDNPTVLISDDKAGCCEALEITHYLDDKNENCVSVLQNPNTLVWMQARGWNHEICGVPRITKLDQFVEVIRCL